MSAPPAVGAGAAPGTGMLSTVLEPRSKRGAFGAVAEPLSVNVLARLSGAATPSRRSRAPLPLTVTAPASVPVPPRDAPAFTVTDPVAPGLLPLKRNRP